MTDAPSPILRARELVVGQSHRALTTPALVLDLDQAERNIAHMAERVRDLGVALRPHVKVHKSPELARRQVAAGAIGVTTATIWEARSMMQHGIDDVLVANQVVGRAQVSAAADLAQTGRLTVSIDSTENAADLSAAARRVGSTIGVLVEVDVGMKRCGVRSPAEALAVAREAAELPALELRGVTGYEGHCMLEPDREVRIDKAKLALDSLLEAVDVLEGHGLTVQIISAGGTGTYDLTGANPRVTEIQAGSYVVMDAFHASLIGGFPVALTVLSTVLSRHGNELVLDAGRKAISADLMDPVLRGHSAAGLYINEEHSGYRLTADSPLSVGDTVELEPGYGPTAVNLYDAYHVVRDEHVVDLWPIQSRYGLSTIS